MVKTKSRGQSIQYIAVYSLSYLYRSFDSGSNFLTFCSYVDFTEEFYSGLGEVLFFVVYWQILFPVMESSVHFFLEFWRDIR